jgi:amino acid transporter
LTGKNHAENIMWIVAIGWSYVVILMAATETSVVAGVMTFLVYCMIPLSILFYLTGAKRRMRGAWRRPPPNRIRPSGQTEKY